MAARTSSEAPETEGAIRAVVMRLARPDGDGGAVVERAAIVAEGELAAAIEAWIIAHGGEPEAPLIRAPRAGLYGPHDASFAGQIAARPPRRYILPAVVMD
jgi:hypothetical protein